jgi:hypothetical protein
LGVAEASVKTFLTIVTAIAASEHLAAEAVFLGLGEEGALDVMELGFGA